MMDISYIRSTHAYVHKAYKNGDYVPIGEEGEYGRVGKKTGAHFKVLGGKDHRYSKDFKVSSSYPETTFVVPRQQQTFEDLKQFLNEYNLFPKKILVPVIILDSPRSRRYGYQYAPPERAPRLNSMKRQLESIEGAQVVELGPRLEVSFPRERKAVKQ